MPELQDGIPTPDRTTSGGRPLATTTDTVSGAIRLMAAGQSFFTTALNSSVSGTLSRIAKETGRRFTSRTVTENGVRGVRVWRVS